MNHNVSDDMKWLAIIFVCFSVFCSCTKKENAVYLNDSLKKYFDYQKGSYWIFYDSLNNNLDSMIVFETDTTKPFHNGVNGNEGIGIYVESYGLGLNTDTFKITFSMVAPCASWLSIEKYRDVNSGLSYATNFTNNIPFDTGLKKTAWGGYNGYYENTFINNLQLGSGDFNNVYKIQFFNSVDSSKDIYYINAEFGFLAILMDNKLFHKKMYLMRSHIVK